LEPSELKIWY